MSREITTHKVNGLNEALRIEALDPPGPGGANHVYEISFALITRPGQEPPARMSTRLEFQNGGIKEAGVNGISNEALLAIVEDRLKAFQNSPFTNRENSIALTHIQEAMMWLERRTRDRMARGVEGTLAK